MSVGLAGLERLLQTLNTAKDSGARRVARAGIQAGLTPLVKTIRQAINGTEATPDVKRQARKTINKSLRKRSGQYVGKAGFGVGRQTAAKRAKALARASAKGGRGVGLSARNVHWFVLGTEERDLSITTRAKGRHGQPTPTGRAEHPTGRIRPMMLGAIKQATHMASSAMLMASAAKVREVLAREAAKAKKG